MTAISLNCSTETDQKAVREQLDRILQSGPFAQSRRRQRFLDYIVTETLAGRGERLKGYNIGLEVFDRPETFDPAIDPIVRIEAARLRDKLREYYEAGGKGDPIRIDLPKGSYAPQIVFRRDLTTQPADRKQAAETGSETAEDEARPQAEPRWKGWQRAATLAALVLLVAAAGLWFVVSNRQLEVEKVEKAERTLPEIPAVAVLPS